jgi:hypothetical protein
MTTPLKNYPSQTFALECLMDKGYSFLRADGEDVLAQYRSPFRWSNEEREILKTIRIKPDGTKIEEKPAK